MRTWEPFTPGRGKYGWHYAHDAVRHVEEHNCAKGCAVPTEKDKAEHGPGGTCPILALLYSEAPVLDLEGTDTHVVCHARKTPRPAEVDGQIELMHAVVDYDKMEQLFMEWTASLISAHGSRTVAEVLDSPAIQAAFLGDVHQWATA